MAVVLCLLLIFALMAPSLDGQILGGPMHGKAVVCYVASWAAYRPNDGQFTLDNLQPALCTHLVYSFAGLNETTFTIKSLDPWQDLEKDYGKAGYKRIVALKERYPHLKVTIAIGGWNEGSERYSKMASSPETRKAFINSVMIFLNQYKFDGLDLDWEYPSKRGGKPDDKANYVSLVKELKEAFEPKSLILTAALGAGKETMESAYDLSKLSRYLDLIHMMCYDYHGTWDGVVGPNAPLRGLDNEDVLSVEYTVKYMISQGVSPYKLVLGLPMYGRTFVLNDASTKRLQFGVTPVESAGFKGPYTREAGFMGYNEICAEVSNKSSPWEYHWHEGSATAYLRDGARVISYDDPRAIAAKVKFAVDNNLGGLMVWSIDTDDFRGHCGIDDRTFKDFTDRYNRMVNDPLLKEALKTLKLGDEARNLHRGTAYSLTDGRLELRLPQPQLSNYQLMQTVNAATTLALEEKRILDEMSRVNRDNEIVQTLSGCSRPERSLALVSLLIYKLFF
ncbi:probable chitinase 2 [Bombyx mori]|uniref:probable chitinase 2 n=1 Tax=Bombyx mori TaxID=7091 RepID=UPI0003500393